MNNAQEFRNCVQQAKMASNLANALRDLNAQFPDLMRQYATQTHKLLENDITNFIEPSVIAENYRCAGSKISPDDADLFRITQRTAGHFVNDGIQSLLQNILDDAEGGWEIVREHD